jgi:hypothetical protein
MNNNASEAALEAEAEAALEAEAEEALESAYEWINKYKETEKEYNIFYKSEVLTIEVNYIFINKNNEIIKRKKRRVKYDKEGARKITDFYPSKLIKKKYKLTAAYKYNNIIEEEDVLNDNDEETNLTPINLEEEIIFEKTIEFFQDLNALYMIFMEVKNNTTKEIGTKEIGTKEIGTKEIGTKEIGTKKHKNNNKNKNTRKKY